jgi:hypothetical protein
MCNSNGCFFFCFPSIYNNRPTVVVNIITLYTVAIYRDCTASRSHDFPSFAYLGVCVCVLCFFLFVYDWLNDIQRNKNIGGILLLSYSNNLPLICFVSIVHVYDGSMDECMRSIWVYMYKKKKKGEIKAEREKEEIYTYSYRVYPRVSHACLIGRLIYRCSFGYWLLRLKGRQKSPFSLFFGAEGTESLSFSNCRPSFVSFCFLKLDFPKSMQRGGGGFFFSILIVFE